MATKTIPMRLICEHPLSNNFGLQNKNRAIITGLSLNDTQIYFDFELNVKQTEDGQPNFTGQFAHGSVKERFLYLTTKNSEGGITKRIKVHLKTIEWEQVATVLDNPKAFLEAQIEGYSTGSVPLLGDGWVVLTDLT